MPKMAHTYAASGRRQADRRTEVEERRRTREDRVLARHRSELGRLGGAVEHNCECVMTADSAPGVACTAHTMLADQCIIDHLLYLYRLRDIFIRGEFNPAR